MTLFSEKVSLLGTENAFQIGPLIKSLEEAGHQVVKCNLGEPDFNLPEYIKEEIKRHIDLNNTHYCDPQGLLPFRKAIADQINETRGLDISPDQVVVFPGAKPPIGLAQQIYLNQGDEVVYPSPGFPIYESFIGYVGAVPVPLHLKEEEGFSFRGQDLEKLITEKTKLIYLNFPSNPTGAVATKEQLEEIAYVIDRKCPEEVRIYSDEVYEYILFDGSKHLSIASMKNMAKRTIIVSGLSKTFAWTGGRVGYAVFPGPQEAQMFKLFNINYFSCVPPYNQEAARLALESPLKDKYIKEMVQTFQKRRDVVVEGLNAIEGITCQKPKGAFYVFPNIEGVCENLGIMDAFNELPNDIKKRTTPSTLFQMFLLFQYDVATMDRKAFGRIGSENRHFLRLSFATDLASLELGIQRIALASKDRDGFWKFIREGKNLYY
ncbi:aspartate aminotransferase [Candidatus Hakubella thermalkaliphila]|uniref:Aspartate aminotransferase n=1 Tax=Candidatus Hakubella thermalkaliphila TaxID=2754717 RepID=A0A6V8PMM9_9ACTN|nr:aspartate aminotransferase [Candidatus Hakubella thermalkaliphila]